MKLIIETVKFFFNVDSCNVRFMRDVNMNELQEMFEKSNVQVMGLRETRGNERDEREADY